MLTKEDIEHLATLARIGVSEEEKVELAANIDSVLEYVSAVSRVVTDAESTPVAGALRNVMREDLPSQAGDGSYPGGEWSDVILANAPHKEDGYFKVEQIM